MKKFIRFQNKKISYSIEGDGETIVLLHGYLESKEIWEETVQFLKNKFKIITIDLPGHGETDVFSDTHSMDFMAETVMYCLKTENINRIGLLGHSMGGYVSLAFAEKYPEMLSGLVLIHSHPFSDNAEKKLLREKESELIKSGKKNLILSAAIPNLYANKNQGNYKSSIERSMKIAMKTPDSGIIAALKGMKSRPDRSKIIREAAFPVLLMIGLLDNLIPAERLIAFPDENKNLKKTIMTESGHMSFFEEKEQFIKEIEKFITFIH